MLDISFLLVIETNYTIYIKKFTFGRNNSIMGKKLHAHNKSLQNSEAIHEILTEEGRGRRKKENWKEEERK